MGRDGSWRGGRRGVSAFTPVELTDVVSVLSELLLCNTLLAAPVLVGLQ